jgi:hypothetical protein
MNPKKGEMSINMIIMVVIAIVILVIVIFLVARSGGSANSATSCPSAGGICKDVCTSGNQIYTDGKGQNVGCPTGGQGQMQTCCNPLG